MNGSEMLPSNVSNFENSAELEDVKVTMKRLKKELKQWEHLFFEQHNRKPTKKDIAAIENIGNQFNLHILI